jgi:regulator of protease activity HflC (stomatin/prohibitin superfamily)
MLAVTVIIFVIFVVFGLRIAEQYQRAVVFRLGRYRAPRGPGLYWIIPLLEWQQMLDIRTMTADVARQEAITKDNVPVKINAVVWYRVFDPKSAVVEVRAVDNAVIQLAMTTLRTGIGQYTLDDVLRAQGAVSNTIGQNIDSVTKPWGVKVERVEMKDVEIPESMQRSIAMEAEAAREKRARLIKAQAELDASEQLRRASEIIMQNPARLGIAANADDHGGGGGAKHHDNRDDAERIRYDGARNCGCHKTVTLSRTAGHYGRVGNTWPGWGTIAHA